MKLITRETVAQKLAAHLRNEVPLDSLVTWAESTLVDDEFDSAHFAAIRDTVAQIGVADILAFGLTWEDCEQLLAQLGYSAHISIVAR